MARASSIELQPGAGDSNDVMGVTFITKAASEKTRGAYFCVEAVLGPEGPPLHRHTGDDEAIYVLEGEVGMQVNENKSIAGPGCFSLVPRGTAHTIWAAGSGQARALLIFSPGETQQFVEGADQVTDLDRIVEIAGKNGLEIVEG